MAKLNNVTVRLFIERAKLPEDARKQLLTDTKAAAEDEAQLRAVFQKAQRSEQAQGGSGFRTKDADPRHTA